MKFQDCASFRGEPRASEEREFHPFVTSDRIVLSPRHSLTRAKDGNAPKDAGQKISGPFWQSWFCVFSGHSFRFDAKTAFWCFRVGILSDAEKWLATVAPSVGSCRILPSQDAPGN